MNIGKKIEVYFKNISKKLVYGKNRPELINSSNAFFHLNKPKKVLVLRNDRIGDLLISEPFFRYLREALPKAEIDVLLSNKNLNAANAIREHIDLVLVYEKEASKLLELYKKIKSRKYDLVIDLFDKASSTSSILCRLSDAKYTIGFDKENRATYNLIVEPLDGKTRHIVERTAQMLCAFALDIDSLDLRLNYNSASVLPKRNHKLLGINLSGSNRSKFWGVQNYIDFIKLINAEYPEIEIRIFSTPDYQSELEQITSATSAKAAPKFKNFDEYALGLSACEYLLTPDTAAVHLASAFEIKTLVLFNQNLNDKNMLLPWTPYKTPHKAFGTVSGDLSEISPDAVFVGFREIWGL